MHTNSRGLALLLSLGSLPIACNKDDNDTAADDSTTGSTTSNTTTGSTGTSSDTTDSTPTSDPTSTGTTTTTMGQTDTTATTTGPQSTTFVTSDSETADTGFETDTGAPAATDPVCIAYGNHLGECVPRDAAYANYLALDCEFIKMSGMIDGPACVKALDAFYVCVSMADCAEFQGDSFPCGKEEDDAVEVCPSLGEGSTDASSG
jgi:hypothetical protein